MRGPNSNEVRIARSGADDDTVPEMLHDSITSFLQSVVAKAAKTSHKKINLVLVSACNFAVAELKLFSDSQCSHP